MDGDETPRPAIVTRRRATPPTDRALTTGGLLLCLAVVGLTLLAIELAYVLLLAFAGVLIAVVLRHAGEAIAARTPVTIGWAIGLILLLVVAVTIAFGWFAGPRVASELDTLADTLPDVLADTREQLSHREWSREVMARVTERVDPREWNLLGTITGLASSVVGFLANLLVVLSVAAFLTVNPALYRQGALRLFPVGERARMSELFEEIGHGLTWWLIGQGVAILFVAAGMALGLWALGVPLPIALGVIAGVTNFIPYLGPYLGGAPAVLIAFAHEPIEAVYVVVLIVVVQQLEGNFVTPTVQRRATSLPPALIIVAVIAAGVLFGLLGILLATPLLLIVVTTTRMLYVEDALERDRRDAGDAVA